MWRSGGLKSQEKGEKEEMARASVYAVRSDDSLVHGAKSTPIAFLPLEPARRELLGEAATSLQGSATVGKSAEPRRVLPRGETQMQVSQSPTSL